MNDHDRIRELFPLAAAGALDESEERDLSAHLASCADCAAELEGWQRSDGSFASNAHPAGAGESCPSRAAYSSSRMPFVSRSVSAVTALSSG